jgi:hypothetical protein
MSRETGGGDVLAETGEGPPGPITKAIVRTLWKTLFDPGAQIYLPRVIRDGYAPWGLPSYDPARPGGTSPPAPVLGVPNELADSACMRHDVPFLPIATGPPALSLTNIEFRNLSAMSPVSLTFSDTEPSFTGVVSIGSAGERFTLEASDKGKPNFLFGIHCCEPVADESRVCSDLRWKADASGQFIGTAYNALVALTVRLNVVRDQPLTVTLVSAGVTAPPDRLEVDFDVHGLPKAWVLMAEVAVNGGIANGEIVKAFETFLNSADVKKYVETLVNNALKRLPKSGDVA